MPLRRQNGETARDFRKREVHRWITVSGAWANDGKLFSDLTRNHWRAIVEYSATIVARRQASGTFAVSMEPVGYFPVPLGHVTAEVVNQLRRNAVRWVHPSEPVNPFFGLTVKVFGEDGRVVPLEVPITAGEVVQAISETVRPLTVEWTTHGRVVNAATVTAPQTPPMINSDELERWYDEVVRGVRARPPMLQMLREQWAYLKLLGARIYATRGSVGVPREARIAIGPNWFGHPEYPVELAWLKDNIDDRAGVSVRWCAAPLPATPEQALAVADEPSHAHRPLFTPEQQRVLDTERRFSSILARGTTTNMIHHMEPLFWSEAARRMGGLYIEHSEEEEGYFTVFVGIGQSPMLKLWFPDATYEQINYVVQYRAELAVFIADELGNWSRIPFGTEEGRRQIAADQERLRAQRAETTRAREERRTFERRFARIPRARRDAARRFFDRMSIDDLRHLGIEGNEYEELAARDVCLLVDEMTRVELEEPADDVLADNANDYPSQ
jgi:hypothetical protein